MTSVLTLLQFGVPFLHPVDCYTETLSLPLVWPVACSPDVQSAPYDVAPTLSPPNPGDRESPQNCETVHIYNGISFAKAFSQ